MNNELHKKIQEYVEQGIKTSGSFDVGDDFIKKEQVNGLVSQKNNQEILQIIKKYFNHQKIKILDLGCGLGGFVELCQKENFDAYGAEIDPAAVKIAKSRVKNPEKIILIDSKDFYFKDQSFDVVTSRCVIEHVEYAEKHVQEAYQALKKNGIFIIFAPNFLFPWEGHYKTIYLPYLMPYCKKCLKIFLKLKGKDTEYLDYINTKITPGYLKKILNKAGFKDINNLSTDRFIDRFENPEKICYLKIRKIIFKIKNNTLLLMLFKIFIKYFLKITQLYHPIILVARK